MNLTGTGAYAIFFNEVSDKLGFDPKIPIEVSQGTCDDAISRDYVLALTKQARKINVESLRSADVCQKLHHSLLETLDPACAPFATGAKWSGLSVKGKFALLKKYPMV